MEIDERGDQRLRFFNLLIQDVTGFIEGSENAAKLLTRLKIVLGLGVFCWKIVAKFYPERMTEVQAQKDTHLIAIHVI